MKALGRYFAAITILFAAISGSAQTQPNLENGFKPSGSYDGSNIDTVNLMNGNLMLHLPGNIPAGQRGEQNLEFVMYSTSKTWAEGCTPSCGWVMLGGGSAAFQRAWEVNVQRVMTSTTDDVTGQMTYAANRYRVVTGDGAVHQLYAIPGALDGNGHPNQFESLDSTAYHVSLSNLDAVTGLPDTAVVTDRQGNLHAGFFDGAKCSAGRGGPVNYTGGNIRSIADNLPSDNFGFSCAQLTYTTSVTDRNGNVITSAPPGNSGPVIVDALGRNLMPQIVSDSSGCVSSLPFAASWLINFPAPGGAGNQVKLCFAQANVATLFDASGVAEASGAAQVLTSAIRPDGGQWTFNYDGYINLVSVTLPMGGAISYTWGSANLSCDNNPSRVVIARTLADNNGHSYTWNYSWGTPANGVLTNVVTDPLGNDTVHVFTALGGNCLGFYETSTLSYEGSQATGQLLQRVDTGYATAAVIGGFMANVFPTSVQTTISPIGKVSLVTRSYDTGLGANAPIFGNVMTEKDYDWGQGAPGALLRETDTTYEWQVNSDYLAAHMLDLPASVVVKDGSGNRVAETDYTYDESAYLTSAGITTQHVAAPASVRGNLTTMSKWLNTSTNPVVSHTNWYDTGEVYQQIDPLGYTTTHSYDSYYVGAYSTKTCNALNQCVSGTYDFNTGLLTSFTDANASSQASGNTPGDAAHTTSYVYDLMSRLQTATLPPDAANGGAQAQTVFQYPNPISLPFTVTKTHSITPSLTDSVTSTYDGLGRVYKTQHPLSNGVAEVDTSYDGLDHVVAVTNPYFSTSDPTYGVIQTQYDAMGRATQVTKQDGSFSTAQYSQTAAMSSNADCTTAKDEVGNQRKTCNDALGRLIEVDEPQASSGSMNNPYVTLYTYDVLGNLLSVNQKGDGSQAARVRNFTYDSLSRLLTATNPESGTIAYSYDADGNLLQKVSPAPNQTGTATQTISYCYDPLNRVTGKAYSAQSCPLTSPVVTYSYDSGANGVGHLSSLTDQPGSGSYSYDVLGRITSEQRTIAGIQKGLSYTYNLDGSVATLKYPSGAVVAYTPDAAGRILSAIDNGNNISYVTDATYGPDSGLTGFVSGASSGFAGITNNFSYNQRLQPVSMAASAPACTGSACTASVTIRGQVNMAITSAGVSAPNAAGNSSLAAYFDPNGVYHLVYEGADQHLYEISVTNNVATGYRDLTLESGAPLAAAGSALAFFLDSNNAPHWSYVGSDQHAHLIYETSGWYGVDLNQWAGGSPAAAAGSLLTSSFQASDYGQIWSYIGTNQHVYELDSSTGSGSAYTDVTAAASAPLAATGSALAFFLDNNNQPHWSYIGSDQHVDLIYANSNGTYHAVDLTNWAGGSPLAAGGSPLTAAFQTSNYGQIWSYLGSNHHLYELSSSTSSAAAYTDVTAAAGAPLAATGSALSFFLDSNNTPCWSYIGSDQHLYLIYHSSAWYYVDLTQWSGGSPLAAAGSLLTSSFLASDYGQVWSYLGTNQHVYELYSANGVTPGYADLTLTTPQMALDAGTVSLQVSGFTATACFGSSSNSACTGQPVNNSVSQVAAALAGQFNTPSSPVTASVSGATINLTWKTPGALAAPIGPLSSTHDNPSLFPNPSFTTQAASFSGGSGASVGVFSIGYDFHLGNGDNGNVYGITNYRDSSRNQSFTYDALNRLTSAQNAGTDCTQHTVNGLTEYWGNSYGYDAWGNLLQKNVTKCSAENLNVAAAVSNQMHTLSGPDYLYDAAGNMTHDATTGNNYSYDQENRITGAAGYTYTYDADGNRVEKSNGTTGTIYWYMSPGIVAESDLSGNLKSEYVFFDGERVARKDYPGGTLSYYFSDHLKTASVITDSAGTIKEDEDFYPWGGELQFVNSDSNHYKFTGKERDAETQLDYFGARHYGNWLGRFITPDWSATPVPAPYADLSDPQSLNLYTYVRDVPTTRYDADGHFQIMAPGATKPPCPCTHDTTAPAPNTNVPPPPPAAPLQNQNSSGNGGAGSGSNSTSQGQSTPADPNQHKPPTYEPSPKHGQEQKGNVSPAPKDGQTALDNSVQVKDTSPRRIGVDATNKQIVVLDQTQGATEESGATFHGHVRSWNQLTSQQQNALKKAGLVDKKGNIITPKPQE